MESQRHSPEHQTEDIQGCRLDDTPLWSGDLNHLVEPNQESESLLSQLPRQKTEAEMARHDPRYGSPGADWNRHRPHDTEASGAAMKQAPAENRRRVTTRTNFLQRCRYECSPTGRSKTALQGHYEEISEATANQPADLRGPRPG
uniref:Uncharacterized protein n=1 Tax=Schistocephalus solidus TaxID=70667 RepID=A0A0X3PLU5_SCHSO